MDWELLIENVVVALRARGDDTIDGFHTVKGNVLHELADDLEEALREARGENE